MECSNCNEKCIKRGKVKSIQRYWCKRCGKHQQETYTKIRISKEKYNWVHRLNNEGCSISGIGRLLHIAKSSVQRIIERLSAVLQMPEITECNQSYELDELKTFCHSKNHESWVAYAINKHTRSVISFYVGRRTSENLKKNVNKVLSLQAKRFYTDGLNIYKTLIPGNKHIVYKHCTNKIERMNLTLRTHLKRLNRKTICFTKSEQMLENCMKLYFCK